ncbi:hypothetical protein FVEG_16665 [Fusarium verticillioides 7600]|uniref:Heterokaryon incompatibility domain-containing protein n=1 Tax=Gibberella moniliformis (strain M3125 / FGSC 7600) TaxID=334819 RepID=W7MSA6_GIBM7|nr:hypothetical protein FVEG_16665 [Fusarium verticillioides 7600]EWG50634.1 hypothetical protein FVEG_16665 [Fusarium verticillioides 7600]
MTEKSSSSVQEDDVFAHLERSKLMFAETLANGTVPIEKELEVRSSLIEPLFQVGVAFSNEEAIKDAIQHIDAILRKLPNDSHTRPKYLNELSKAKFELFQQLDSGHSLDLAVLYGRQAKELAVTSNLSQLEPDTYIQILINLGHVLAHRYQTKGIPKDIDESIACKRELLGLASKTDDVYFLTLNNLASSLNKRYQARQGEEDEHEAQQLLQQLVSSTSPGTKLRGVASAQLGLIAFTKFKRTASIEDLDDALAKCKLGLDYISKGDDGWLEMVHHMAFLHGKRFELIRNVDDINSMIQYSCLWFDSTPNGRLSRTQDLLSHMRRIETYAFGIASVEAVRNGIKMSLDAFSRMPEQYPAQEKSQLIFAHMLSYQYSLTHKLDDLMALSEFSASMMTGYNKRIASGFGKQEVLTSWVHSFISWLQKLRGAPEHNSMRILAEEELIGAFISCFDPDNGDCGIEALETVYSQNKRRLQVLAAAAKADITISEEEIEIEASKVRERREPSNEEFLKMLFGPAPPPYQTEFGQRTLAIDPETKRITFDFSNMIKDVMGYELGPVSPDEFVAREERIDRESLEKGRAEGKHPNTRLCHWCRTLTKPLQPSDRGFELTSSRCLIPHLGDWKMVLYCRGKCAICSLAASMFTTDKGELHPNLALIDEEARGIPIMSGKLSNNESILRIDFGTAYAGELRILRQDTIRQTLRQGWQIAATTLLDSLMQDPTASIYNTAEQTVNLELIKRWLGDCDHNHGPRCNHPRPGKRISNEIPLNFIDVKQQCLVRGTSNDKYFALSYTWGRVDMCMTLQDNCQSREVPGALSIVPFPKSIRDAITFVASLGYQFLWIDAVCIIQDDPASKGENIPNMDIIYGRAFATVVALFGSDADAGLPGVSPGTRVPQRVESLPITRGSWDLEHDASQDSETVYVVKTPRPFYLALQTANWNTRGWIMQERLLSRRCIYFGPEAVYFQCGQKTFAEGGLNEEFETYMFSAPMEDRHLLNKANHNNPIEDLTHLHDLDSGSQLWEAFKTYTQLVRDYSKREFTFKGDVLNGFGGIFAVLDDEHFQGSIASRTMSGIPTAIFVHALLWTPAAKIPRRGERFATQKDINMVATQEDIDMGKPDPRFPSWSWAGWDGPVDYTLFAWAAEKADRPLPLINSFYKGSIEILADKWEEAGRLMAKHDESKSPGPSQTAGEDTAKKESKADTIVGATSSPIAPDVIQKQNISDGNLEDQTSKKVDKGKGKAIEAPPRKGHVWLDPDSHKLWLWIDSLGPKKRDLAALDNMLRMSGPVVSLNAFKIAPNKQYLSVASQVHSKRRQSVRRILNSNNNHCGLYWEQGGYEWLGNDIYPDAEKEMIMLGVSEYGACYRPREGPKCVEGFIPIFDKQIFPEIGSESGLVNVLVVNQNTGFSDSVGERISVAIIHKLAWEAAGPKEKEVKIV